MTKTEEWEMEGGKGFHPAVYIFPEMTGPEFEEFKGDIKEHGLRVPIVTTPDGLILDGRHRWNACMALKIKPSYQVHAGDPWAYVISANLHRRHLTTSQRAMVADRLRSASVGGYRDHDQSEALKRPDQNDHGKRGEVTRTQAAELLKVSPASVHDAGDVRKRGVPELASVVDEGRVPVATAARVAKTLDVERQKDFVERVRKGHKPKDILVGPPPLKKTRAGSGRDIERHIFSSTEAQGLSGVLGGMQIALRDITEVHSNVTPQEAKFLVTEIGKTKTILNRLQALLKKVE